MAAGRLDVLLGLDAAEFTSGLTKAELEAQAFQKSMVELGSKIGVALAAGMTAAAGAAAVLIKSTIDARDHLNDLSKATQVSVEELGGIGFAASQAGTDLDGTAAAFGKLNIKIAEAARGEKEAAEAFGAIGVAVKDASGKTRSAQDVFKDIATAFASFKDGPEKAALGMALFGKSYQSLLPLLADGGKALQDNIEYYKQFGGTTAEAAKAADEFNDTLGKIKLLSERLGKSLTDELLPALQILADEFLKMQEGSNGFNVLAKAARVAFETIVILAANVKFVFEGVGREIGAIAAQIVALATLDIDGFHAISDAVKEDGKRARKELDDFEKRILQIAAGPSLASKIGTANPDRALQRLSGGLVDAPRLGGPPGAKAPKEQIDDGTQAYARYIEKLDDAIGKNQQLTKTQEALRAIEENRFGTLIPQQKELLLLMAKEADAADEYAAKIKFLAEQERQANAEALKREDLIETKTGRKAIRETADQLKIFDEELAAGRISIIEYDLATHDIFRKQTDEIKKTTDAASEFGLTFASAIGEFIKHPTDGKTFLSALLDDLLQITTQLLIIKPLTEGLTEVFGGAAASSSGGKQVAGFGNAIGDFFKSIVGSFAAGTDYVPADGLAMVHKGEKIVPASENKRGGGSSMSIVNNWPAGTTRETAAQAGAAFAQKLAGWNRRFN